MGNFQTGIKDEGVIQTLTCKDCCRNFEARVGVVTIKGKTRDPERCKGCHTTFINNFTPSFCDFGEIKDEVTIDKGKIVDDQYKSVMTLHYANWCPHTKTVLPEWKIFEDYAKEYLPELKVNKICYQNGLEPNNSIIKGYPTIIFESQGKDPVTFDYDRQVQFFIKFAKENMNQ
jgi:hypothetical protein